MQVHVPGGGYGGYPGGVVHLPRALDVVLATDWPWLGLLAGHPDSGYLVSLAPDPTYGKSVTETGHVRQPGYGPYVWRMKHGAVPRRGLWPLFSLLIANLSRSSIP